MQVEMYRRRVLVTGLAIAGALAGCTGDDGNGAADQNGGTGETDQDGGTGETDQDGGTGETDQDGGTGETDQDGDSTGELTGIETYSGEWSGTIGGQSYSGVWEFEANFDNGQVEGMFRGDGQGDITGTITGGEIDAQGGAAFGTVEWSGEFSSGGQEISGTWELAEDLPGSGTWSGSVGELEEDNEEVDQEDGLPEEDQVSGDEPLPRYPGSVMLHHRRVTADEGSITEIDYGTTDSLDEVVQWYKDELGDPNLEETQEGETTLGYLIEQNELAEIQVSANDFTEINLEYKVKN